MSMLEDPLIIVDLFVEEESMLDHGKRAHSEDSLNSNDGNARMQNKER